MQKGIFNLDRPALTRREFSLMAAAALSTAQPEHWPPKVLVVVAHPDDEYAMAATVYRLAKELGAVVDQVVISNGEGGYRYAALAEQFYGIQLTDEKTGRERLPEIRKRETLAAGRILGIRNHHFLGETDGGYTLDGEEAFSLWRPERVRRFLSELISAENYQFVLTLLPSEETHGHHKAAAALVLKALQSLPEDARPVVLGAEAGSSAEPRPRYAGLTGVPESQAAAVYEFPRKQRFGFKDALDYSIVANWVIAEHKSQGLFQTDAGKHDVERFWVIGPDATDARKSAHRLFGRLAVAGQQLAGQASKAGL